MQRAKDFIRKKQAEYTFNHKLNKLKNERIELCDSHLAKRILKKQTALVTNSDR